MLVCVCLWMYRSITDGLKYCLATGNWGADRKSISKAGVAQVRLSA